MSKNQPKKHTIKELYLMHTLTIQHTYIFTAEVIARNNEDDKEKES